MARTTLNSHQLGEIDNANLDSDLTAIGDLTTTGVLYRQAEGQVVATTNLPVSTLQLNGSDLLTEINLGQMIIADTSFIEVARRERGFDPDTVPTLSWTNISSTLTVTLTGTYVLYLNGHRFSIAGDSIAISHTALNEGVNFVYYLEQDGDATLIHSITPWSITYTMAPVAVFYWNDTSNTILGGLGYELHQSVIDFATHYYLHNTRGTAYVSGFGISGYTLNTDSNAAVTFGLGSGIIADEDIAMHIEHSATPNGMFQQYLNDPAKIPVYYREGANGNWRKSTANDYSVILGAGGRPNYNLYSGGTWQQSETTNSYYCAYFIYASNLKEEPVIAIQGQRQDTSVANARANNIVSALNLGTLFAVEFKLLYRIIYQARSGDNNAIRARIIEIEDYRGSSATGNVAVPVQDHGQLSGLGDPDHPASAIYTDVLNFNGLLSGTDDTVQDALDTLDEHTHTFASLTSKPTTLSGYGITDAQSSITAGTTSQYWRGDKSWQTLDKSAVGLGNVENTALSAWSGSSNLTTAGALTVASLSVTGALTVNGSTTTVNSTTVTVDDPILTLGGDTAPSVDDNKDRGLEFRWHNGSSAKVGFFGFDDSTGYLTFIPDATNTSEVFSGTPGDIQATNFRGALIGNASTVTNGVYTTGSYSDPSWLTISKSKVGLGNVENTALSTWSGSSNLTTVGTVTGISFNSITGLGSSNPVMNGVAAVGTATTVSRQDHVHPSDTSKAATNQTMYIGTTAVAINRTSGSLSLSGITSIDGSAATLTTSRTINGTSFNGSANITTSSWGTARTITIGSTGKSVDGSGNVSWSLSEIGAQASDADLTAIAALAGTSGFLKKTNTDTWSLDTSTYLTANQSISISGDATGSGTTSISLTLANSGVSAGTYNNVATEVRPFTVDVKGRITSIGTAVSITAAWSSISGKPTTLSGFGITDAAGLTASNVFTYNDTSAYQLRITQSNTAGNAGFAFYSDSSAGIIRQWGSTATRANLLDIGTLTNNAVTFLQNSLETMRISTNGNLLIGTVTDTYTTSKLQLYGTSRFTYEVNNPSNDRSFWFNTNLSGSTSAAAIGFDVWVNSDPSFSCSGAVYGTEIALRHGARPGTGTGNIASYYGITISNAATNGATITNCYGIYITNIGSITNKWGIYDLDGKWYTGGSILIGSPTDNGLGHKLQVSGGITSTLLDIKADGTHDNNTGQCKIIGSSNSNQQLIMGYDTTNDYGWIAPVKFGDSYKNLVMNRYGGNVLVGTATDNSTGSKLQVNGHMTATSINGKQATDQSAGSGTVTLNLNNGEYFKVTATGNIAIALSGLMSGFYSILTLEAINFGAYTITWPTGTKWPGGVAPALSSSGKDLISFTIDSSGVILGTLIGRDLR